MNIKKDFNRIVINTTIRTLLIGLIVVSFKNVYEMSYLKALFSGGTTYILTLILITVMTFDLYTGESYPKSMLELEDKLKETVKKSTLINNWSRNKDYMFFLEEHSEDFDKSTNILEKLGVSMANIKRLADKQPKLEDTFRLDRVYKTYLELLWNPSLHSNDSYDIEDIISGMDSISSNLETYLRYMDIKDKNVVDKSNQFKLETSIKDTISDISGYHLGSGLIKNMEEFEDALEYTILTKKFNYTSPIK